MPKKDHNRPDLMATKETFVYFARAYPSGLIKIGYSGAPNDRAHSLAWELGEGVSLLFTVPGNRVQERGFHKRFADYRSHGEWFHEAGALHEFLREKGFAGARVVIEKQFVHLTGPTRLVEVLTPHIPDVPDYQPRIIGYARVSTEEQSLDVQLADFKRVGAQNLYVEKISATNSKRPQFHLMMKFVERGDMVYFHSLSRLCRGVENTLVILRQLKEQGVQWKSITEPYCDDLTAAGKFMTHFTASKDELELNQLSERTVRGMQERKRQGIPLGRCKLFDPKQTAAIKRDRKVMTREEVAAKWNCSPGTIDKYAA